MMLVVAVALSTATYAWFTSNAGVTAQSITLTADSNAGLALGISWGADGNPSTSISAYGGGTLKPLMPAALTETSTQPNVAFSGGTTYSNNGVATFNDPVYTSPAPYYYKQAAEGTDVIKLTNLAAAGGNAISTITITPTIALNTANKDASDLVRIAIFYSATNNGTYTLVKVLAANSAADGTVYGTATASKAVGTGLEEGTEAKAAVCIQGIYDAAQTCTLPTVSAGVTIAANSSVYIKVVMWMDGQAFTDAYATYDATVSLAISAS